MKTQTVRFPIENLTYELTLSELGVVCFEMVGGRSKRGSTCVYHQDPYNLFPEYPNLSDTGLLSNAMPLFRKVGEIVCSWVLTYKPPRFAFTASTTRKIKIYRWLAQKLAARLIDSYSSVEYPPGEWNFYRVITC
jgi:hypothetical protein